MPKNVRLFEKLWYGSLGIGILNSILEYQYLVNLAGIGFLLIIEISIFVLTVFFIWLIARMRKGWARWVIFVFFVIGAPFYIPQLSEMLERNILVSLLSILQVILQILGLCFVFTGDSVNWFKKSEIEMVYS